MKRFAFRLERLLELRAWHERRAELVLAERAGACAVLETRIAENLTNRARASREAFAQGREIADYRAAEFYVRRLDIERDRLSRELAVAEAAREEARVAWIEKHRERESVGKLRERREAEYYRLAEREEVKALDDIARHPARQAALGGSASGGVAAGSKVAEGVVSTWQG